jgi:hypothetical protein
LNELVHMTIEGLFALLLGVVGFMLKTLWNDIQEVRREGDGEIRELRDKIEKIKDVASCLELRIEREFVKHTDLTWIKDKLDQFEKILQEIRLSMARHHRAEDVDER